MNWIGGHCVIIMDTFIDTRTINNITCNSDYLFIRLVTISKQVHILHFGSIEELQYSVALLK